MTFFNSSTLPEKRAFQILLPEEGRVGKPGPEHTFVSLADDRSIEDALLLLTPTKNGKKTPVRVPDREVSLMLFHRRRQYLMGYFEEEDSSNEPKNGTGYSTSDRFSWTSSGSSSTVPPRSRSRLAIPKACVVFFFPDRR